MPFSNPTPAIAYASLTGSADVSSAAPCPHSNPAPPFSNSSSSFNIEHLTSDQSPAPPPSTPSSALALFLQVLHIASVVIVAIAQRMDSDLHCLTLLQGCEAINCLYSIIRIQLTIDRHPERITPAELRRLAKASRYINRLARQKLDFSLFTTTQDNEQQATNNKPSPNPQSANPQSSLPRLNVSGLRSTPVCHSPGATLARTCQSLCRILKLLPDLAYDPSGTVATLDLANPASLSPATPSLGARTPSSAIPLPPANPATPSPYVPQSNSLPSKQDAVSRVRQPCCRFSSPTPAPSSSAPTPSTNPAPSSTPAFSFNAAPAPP